MLTRLIVTFCFSAGLTGAIASAETPPREFSADIISRDAAGSVIGAARLYAANRKVRIESPEASAGYFLIDAGTAVFVRPAQKVFMGAGQSTRLSQLFIPVDANAPCLQWQAAAKDAGAPEAGGDWRCERVATDMIGGRVTLEYRLLSPLAQSGQRWIDADLEFPIKLRAADGATIALEHVHFEPQPASLFAIPPEFRRLEPKSIVDRVKHSDVWAEPPK